MQENRLLRKALNPSSEKAFAELRAAQRLIATLEDDIGASNASLDDVKVRALRRIYTWVLHMSCRCSYDVDGVRSVQEANSRARVAISVD